MLDVHPPHTPTHTWRDFLIHIATIVIGLLIAVGLEQTVEFFHHRHQLHQLQDDLRTESRRNLHLALEDLDVAELRQTTGLATYREVVAANLEHRLPVIQDGSGLSYKPANAVWTIAQQSGTLGLLPREEAQQHVRVYSVVDQLSNNQQLKAEALAKLRDALLAGTPGFSAEQRALDQNAKDSAAWAGLKGDDFIEARNALAYSIGVDDRTIGRCVILYVTEWGVLHGSLSDEETVRTVSEALAVYRKGGKAALLAKYPLSAVDEGSTSASR